MTSDFAAVGEQAGDGGAGGGLVERGEDAAAGVEALGDLEAEVAGDERGEAAGHAVGAGAWCGGRARGRRGSPGW